MEQQNQQPTIPEQIKSKPPIKLFLLVALIAVVVAVVGIFLLKALQLSSDQEENNIKSFELCFQGDIFAGPEEICKLELGRRGLEGCTVIEARSLNKPLCHISARCIVECPTGSERGDTQVSEQDGLLDPIASWQIYRNEEFGFEVRYPSNWRVNAPEVAEGDFIQIDNYLTDREGGEKTMQIFIYKDNPKPENGFDVEDSNYRIDNLLTKTYYFMPNRDFGLDDIAVPKPTPHVVIRMEKNNKSYRFLLFNTDRITGVYSQILDTFRFVPAAP